MSRQTRFVVALLVGLIPLSSSGGESPFGWIYLADVHPAGTREFEQWFATQAQQSQGDYTNVLSRSELEFGITGRYQTSLYVNSRYVGAYRNGVDGSTSGPDTDLSTNFNPDTRYRRFRFESISWENLYQVLNPLTDSMGLALYVEPAWGPDVKELEVKVILQKNFLDDRLLWAANIVSEIEKEQSSGETERATSLEFVTGVSYRVANHWSLGLEGRNHREFEGYGFNNPEHSAWFLGPNLHYAAQRWWATVAWRQQLKEAVAFNDEQRDVIVHGRIYGDEHSRDEFMVRFGIPF